MSGYIWRARVNGGEAEIETHPAARLHYLLREELGLTGTKVSCELGRCGACMVLLDGKPVNSCLVMAYQCEDKAITTIEGLADGDDYDPVQQAFLEEGGFQCGYCTPGMIIAAKALLEATPRPTTEQIQEGLSGNLCRCTGYGGILRAVRACIRT